MLFPSFTFILGFLPITFLGYFLLGKFSRSAARIFLLIASGIFYSWFNPSYFLILGGSIVVNYFLAGMLWKNHHKAIFITGLILNVALLGYFKYCDFFISNINYALNLSIPFTHILLPLGISFFTFQQISFLHAVYSGELKQRYTFSTYALFVSFFPQLIAGPIVLPDEMMVQFDHPDNLKINAENCAKGLFVFSLGLAKKILLADFLAEIADAGFAAAQVNFISAWTTTLAYTFQIYFDFSGYCDMAIGIGLLFNIRLPENFHAPYLSGSITEFWRRWHITLGRFLMNYIYIPLGGSKKSPNRTFCNLMITFLVSGLWHGASWLFVLWGAMHGIASVIHRIWSKIFKLKMPELPAKLVTFFFVASAWVLFRAENLAQARKIYKGMFSPDSWGHFTFSRNFLWLLAGALIIIFVPPVTSKIDSFRPTKVNAFVAIGLLVVSMFFFVKTSPFIYFNF